MAFDPAGRPLQEKVTVEQTEETLEEQKRKEEDIEYADKRLRQLVRTDEMYKAIEYFLLGDPVRQIAQLGDVGGLLKTGDEAKQNNDSTKSRYSYETAAKIELYRGEKESLRKFLILAQEVTSETDKYFKFQQTILDNIDDALRIAKDYYNTVPQATET
jgi:hypothetical protein